jgi:hypothetical protein
MDEPGYRLTAETYVERLKDPRNRNKNSVGVLHGPNAGSDGNGGTNADKEKSAVAVVAGADYINSIPHAPWPSRAMLKRRVVLGTPEIIVRNGVTRIVYPRGAIYEGEVKDRKRSAVLV